MKIKDTITKTPTGFKGKGDIATTLINSGMDAKSLRSNDVLRKDEWEEMDDALLKVAEPALVGVGDLMSRGLVVRLGNGLGTTVFEYEDMSDISGAEISMDAESKSKEDLVEFDINHLPMPIIHKGFSLNIRQLEASRQRGQALDTTLLERATRKVSVYAEDLLFNGTGTYTYGGGTIYGYRNHPNRNTYSITDWDSSAASGATMLADLLGMKQALLDDNHFGPFGVYISSNYETSLGDDYKANSDKSIRQRLLEVDGVEFIKVTAQMALNNVVMTELMAETVRMVEGLGMQVVEWKGDGNLRSHYKVMTILIPQIRSDQSGQCGICHGS